MNKKGSKMKFIPLLILLMAVGAVGAGIYYFTATGSGTVSSQFELTSEENFSAGSFTDGDLNVLLLEFSTRANKNGIVPTLSFEDVGNDLNNCHTVGDMTPFALNETRSYQRRCDILEYSTDTNVSTTVTVA